MHQQPPQAPRAPKRETRSGQREGVRGWNLSAALFFSLFIGWGLSHKQE
jgi:hypothetical protein